MVVPPTHRRESKSIVLSKDELRRALRTTRQSVESALKHSFWLHAPASVVLELIQDETCVGYYYPLGSEVDPLPFYELAGGCAALPWISGRNGDMMFRTWQPGQTLEKSAFGFVQPRADAQIVVPDIIIAPLVGFDRALDRLGQGAGHYDRFFAKHSDAIRIGVAFACQESDGLSADLWDIQLDAIITEREFITAPHSRISAS